MNTMSVHAVTENSAYEPDNYDYLESPATYEVINSRVLGNIERDNISAENTWKLKRICLFIFWIILALKVGAALAGGLSVYFASGRYLFFIVLYSSSMIQI